MLRFGGSTVVSSMMLSACGGDSEPPAEPDVEIAPAADGIGYLPDAEVIDRGIALQPTIETISVKVFFGDAAQASALVNVYDVDGALLASGATNEDGYFYSDQPGKCVLLASAQTAHGTLYGYSYTPDGVVCPSVNVNVYQTLAAHMAERLGLQHNIINFLLQRHFAIGFNETLQSVDVDDPYFSQNKFARACQASGLALDAFMVQLADSLTGHLEQESDPVLDYLPDASGSTKGLSAAKLGALPDIDDETRYKIVEFALDKIEGIVTGFVRFPYSDEVISFFFDKMKGKLRPPTPDPLAEVKEKLNIIIGKLDEIAEYLQKQDIQARWNEMLKRWAVLNQFQREFNEASSADSAAVARTKFLNKFYAEEGEIKTQVDWFFGGHDVTPENSFLSLYSQFISKLPYYSADVQERIDNYVANFVLQQTNAIGFAMAMITVEAKMNGVPVETLQASLESYQKALDEARRLAALYQASKPQLPATRLLIHKESRTVWAGLCGTVGWVTDWMPPSLYTRRWQYIGVSWYGTGSSAGVDNAKYMPVSATNPNGVSADVIAWADWKLPSTTLVRQVFITPAKARKDKKGKTLAFDVFSNEMGIPQQFPMRKWDFASKKYENKFAVVATDTFIKNSSVHFCWEEDFVRFDDYGIYQAGLSTKYQGGATYAYFPYADIAAADMGKYDVNQIYASFYRTAFAST